MSRVRPFAAALVGMLVLAGGCQFAPLLEPKLVVDGNERLGREVVPRHYWLDLRIDPATDRFSGKVMIEVAIADRTDRIALHAMDLMIERASVRVADEIREATWTLGPHGGLALHVAPPLEPGEATIEIEYAASLPKTPYGLYRVEVDDRYYAFTQFEPLDARRAFPCFDQPDFKTPYDVTLRTRPDLLAVSNAPEVSRFEEGGDAVFQFAPTRPLPSYLVAFAVGDFDVVPVAAGPDAPPMRVLAVSGRGRLAEFAAQWAPKILRWQMEYMGGSFPFAKLDLIAVPNFRAGAMENVGLVTFRERLLLVDAESGPLPHRVASLAVIAHEVAHMWFGNLVTMAWWDDLWLNESFASWMASKTMAALVPELEIDLQQVTNAQYVMALDARRDAQPVQRPIRNGGDVYNAFDGITYGKGEAILRMVESWIGSDAFRLGVRRYVDAHAYGNAVTADLIREMASVSTADVGAILRSFVHEPGTPQVDVRTVCDADGAHVSLAQTRYSTRGDASAPTDWSIPMCLVWGGADAPALRIRDCFVLSESASSHRLAGEICPAWLHPNADEVGYYRWRTSEAELLALLRDHADALSPSEQVALPGLTGALLQAGDVSLAGYLDALAALSESDHWRVVDAVSYGFARLKRTADASGLSEQYAAFVRELLAPTLQRIGLDVRPLDGTGTRLVRPTLLATLADTGLDAEVRAHALRSARAFIADPSSVSGDLAGTWLAIAAWSGDASLWQGMSDLLAEPLDPWQRSEVVEALGHFEDAALVRRSLDLVLSGRLRAQDYPMLVRWLRPNARTTAFDWLTENYDALVEVLGEKSAAGLPAIGQGFCDREDAERLERFFEDPRHAPQGTARNLNAVLDDIDRCVRLREAAEAPLREYLGARS